MTQHPHASDGYVVGYLNWSLWNFDRLSLRNNPTTRKLVTAVGTPELGETVSFGPASKHLLHRAHNSTFDIFGNKTTQNRLQSIPMLSYDCP
ncbi:MAG: hypothetical protein ABFD46_03800 [Armatimonadota bacterium]